MTWHIRIPILVLCVIFSIASVSGGVGVDIDVDKAINQTSCSDCHNSQLGTASVDTDRCSSCHENHELTQPSRFSGLGKRKATIHDEHIATNNQAGCKSCHSPPACNRCHNGHSPETKECKNCHGTFPAVTGHKEEASIFRYGKHNWMGCTNCHQGTQFHFRDFTFLSNESSKLCSICHSVEAKDEKHSQETACVTCHNPHSTSEKGKIKVQVPDIESIDSFIGDILKPVKDNSLMVLIGIILIASVVAERVFKRKQ